MTPPRPAAGRIIMGAVCMGGLCGGSAAAGAQPAHAHRAADSTYAAYTVGSCVQAVRRTTSSYWRAGPDSSRYTPERDTMLTAAREVARRCRVGFHVATVRPRDLLLFADLSLAAGDDTAAAAAITRRLAWERGTTGGIRAHTLAQVVSIYVNAKPNRVARARPYLAMLDTMRTAAAAVWQLGAHTILLRHAYDVTLDDAAAEAEARAVIAAGKRLTPHDREEFGWALLQSYGALAYFAAESQGFAGAHAVLQRARGDIGALRDVARQLDDRDSLYALYGTAAPPLSGVWFGVAPDVTRPEPGIISLVVLSPSREIVPALRRLKGEFGGQLDITIVAQTVGYFDGRGPLAPATEMAYLWRHYRDTLRAPGALVLSETKFRTLPDGRRLAEPTENQRAYRAPYHAGFVLADRQGVIRTVQSRFSERRLAAAIRRLL